MKKTIITAGSGPSYSRWQYWPTWTKLLPLYFGCKHIDVSAPAAGNLYICRSVINQLQNTQPDTVLVQWNFGKFDLYLENQEFIDVVLNSKSIRNFIVDPANSKTTTSAGYWCSSNDNTVEWKKHYNEKIKSKAGTAMDDLQNMLTLQNLCYKKNIYYRFFTHSDVDHDFLSTNKNTKPIYKEIDWTLQVIDRSLQKIADAHPSAIYNVSPERESIVPCADIQWFLLDKIISPVLLDTGYKKNKKYFSLELLCKKFTKENYEKYKKN
jgi:hypothetical protein